METGGSPGTSQLVNSRFYETLSQKNGGEQSKKTPDMDLCSTHTHTHPESDHMNVIINYKTIPNIR